MGTGKAVSLIIFSVLAIGAFIISCLQFMGKGYLFNNAYFWASKEERKRMDENKQSKKPYYRQSGFAFMLIGIMCLAVAVYSATDWKWMYAAFVLSVIITVVYAVVSSVKLEQHQAKTRK